VASNSEEGSAKGYLQNKKPLARGPWQHVASARQSASHFRLVARKQRQAVAQGTRIVPFGVCVVYYALDDTLSMELVENIPRVMARNGG